MEKFFAKDELSASILNILQVHHNFAEKQQAGTGRVPTACMDYQYCSYFFCRARDYIYAGEEDACSPSFLCKVCHSCAVSLVGEVLIERRRRVDDEQYESEWQETHTLWMTQLEGKIAESRCKRDRENR